MGNATDSVAVDSTKPRVCVGVGVMKKLYTDNENVTYLCPGFTPSTPVVWTEQTPNVFACGLHVLSHIYLVSKGLEHTHMFDNEFVEEIRVYCVQLLHDYRTGRRTTYMSESNRFDKL